MPFAVNEFELKFQVPLARAASVQADVARGRSSRHRLEAHYYDTADGALAAQHLVLRLRREDGAWVQTAKGPTEALMLRLEHNVPITGKHSPAPSIARHAGTAVGERLAAALRDAGHDPQHPPLVRTYATRVQRTTRLMRSGDALVELAFDQGQVVAGERRLALCELEFELRRGDPRGLFELARRWCARHALWLDMRSKSARGEWLARGELHGPAVHAQPPRIADAKDAASLWRAVLDACARQILANASEVADGSDDAEHIHQLRVGIRRLRSALRDVAPCCAAEVPEGWVPALRPVFLALGEQRDRTLLREVMQPRLEAAGAPPVDWPPADTAALDVGERLRGAPFQSLLLDLVEATLPPAPDDAATTRADPARPPRHALRKRLAALARQLARDAKRFESLDTAQQHRVRKRLKRLRYLLEFTAALFDARRTSRYLARLRPAQDALGERNDEAIAARMYRNAAAHDPRAWFAVGWLAANQATKITRCAKTLRKALDNARPGW